MEAEMRYQAIVQRIAERERTGIPPVPYFALQTMPCICCARPSSKWLSELRENFMPDRDSDEYSSSDDFENSAEIQDSSCCSKQGNSSVRVQKKTSRETISSNNKDNFCVQESTYRGPQQESRATPDEIMVESPKDIDVDAKINSSVHPKEGESMKNVMIPNFDIIICNLQQQSSGSEELSSEDRTDISTARQINRNHKTISSNVPAKNVMIPCIEDLQCAAKGESSTAGEPLTEKSRNTSLALQKNARSKFEQARNYIASLKEQSERYNSEELVEMIVKSSFEHQKIENPEDPTDGNESVKRLLAHSSLNLDSYDILPPIRPMKVKGPIWKNSDYKKARDEIYSKISFDFKSCLIVWCPFLDTRIELVDKVLPKYGKIIISHDRWMRPGHGLTGKTWGGVFVAYETEKEAKLAAKEIPKNYRPMKTLELSKLLHCLIKSELELFKQQRQETTDVFVNLPVNSDKESRERLGSLLLMMGEVELANFYNIKGKVYIQYKMPYTCAAYAFLAMTVLDGFPIQEDTLKVVVNETRKETAILKDILFRVSKYTGGAYFPFNGMR